ncbi:MAG: hypothetical protein JSV27_04655 [Candidatus Bathyarchaeota archaeon]|nr:MAG: hypothetical protein JSV27_04655 [Candidatus Bathyarchaeota archaeon]
MVTLETVLQVIPALSVSIAAIYYALNIRNQRETRQAQLFMQMYNSWKNDIKGLDSSKPFFPEKISGLDEYQERYASDERFRKMFDVHIGFYEGLGVLVKTGYIDIHLVALMWAGLTRMFYENVIEPMLEEAKEYYNMPRLWSETVYVCKELIKYMDEHQELKT